MQRPFLGLALLLAFSACGKTQPPYFHEALAKADHAEWAGQYVAETGEIRFPAVGADSAKSIAHYPADSTLLRDSESCSVWVDPEKDPLLKQQTLEKLAKIWRRYLVASSTHAVTSGPRDAMAQADKKPAYTTFEFDPLTQSLNIGPGGFLEPSRTLRYRRLCLSTPLKRTDAYQGMRILEIEVAQTAATVAFGFRIQNRSDGRKGEVLLMSRLRYDRYGQEARHLKSVDSVFAPFSDQELGVPIWVFLGE